jgi:hypothetical protein
MVLLGALHRKILFQISGISNLRTFDVTLNHLKTQGDIVKLCTNIYDITPQGKQKVVDQEKLRILDEVRDSLEMGERL